jgi:hypothetical protein
VIVRAYGGFVAGFILWASFISLRDHGATLNRDDARILLDMYALPFFEWVFSGQAGHRVPLTLLLFAADYHWLDGEKHLLVLASIVTLGLALGVLWLACRSGRGLASPLSQLVFAAVCLGLFWAASIYNLLCGVCHANTVVLLFGFASLGLLVRHALDHHRSSDGPGWTLPLALVAGVCATFGMAQGIAIWPALLAVAILARLPLRSLGWILLTTVVVAAGVGSSIAQSTASHATVSPIEAVLFHPLKLVRFAATLIGGLGDVMARQVGLDEIEVGPQSAVIGMAGLILFAGHARWVRRHARLANSQDLLALGIMAFATVVALGIALTRLFAIGPQQALHTRFLDWSALFWAGAFLSLAAFGRRSQRPAVWLAAGATLILVTSSILVAAHHGQRRELMLKQEAADDAALAIFLGVDGAWEKAKIHRGTEEEYRQVLGALERDGKGLYADARRTWIGQPLEPLFRVEPARCKGGLHALIAPNNMKRDEKRLRGWVQTRGQGGTPESIVLTNDKGVIRGLGNVRREYRPRGPGESTWTAWVTRSWRKKSYSVFVVLDDGRTACPIGKTPPESA